MRCVHEASLHTENSFLTLTYDDEHLPEHGSLQKQDLQKFWKRLRDHLGDKTIRYYACGEYGDVTKRAHYHACLFGHDFTDKKPLRKIGEHVLYTSATLNRIWGMGHTSIGNLTFETAAYTARYVTKKQTGLASGRGYYALDNETGELIPLQQPYAAMSLRDAIAKQWHQRFHSDIYNADKDYIVLRGKKLKPAKYYDKLYDIINPDHMEKIKEKRKEKAEEFKTTDLRAREEITRARMITRKQI